MESTVPISPALSPHSLAPNTHFFFPDSYSLQFSHYTDPNPFNFTSAFRSQSFPTVAQGVVATPPQNGGLLAIEEVKSRSRDMSQSSTDGEDVNDVRPLRKSSVALGDDVEPNRQNLKRKTSDAIDYPRRRATIAVCFSSKLPASFHRTTPRLRPTTVRNLPVEKIKMRWRETKMSLVLGTKCRLCIPRTRSEAGRWRQIDSRKAATD